MRGALHRLRPGGRPARTSRDSASILVGLLWCLALLSVLVVGILHSARLELQLTRFHMDRLTARYLALAGVEKAKALLYRDARQRSTTAQNHSGSLFNAPQLFKDVSFGRGTFRVFRGARPEEGGGVVFGVDDEESRLNINTANADDLLRLQGLRPEVAASVIDWRDGDSVVTPGGAELEYYATQRPPSRPRDGPLQTVRELLMVRGMDPRLFLGGDTHFNGFAGESSDEGEEGTEAVGGPGMAVPGWAAALTVDSGVNNVSASGQDRVNVQTADEATLTTLPGITSEIAKGIVAHRSQNRFQSLGDLLDVGPAPPATPGGNPGQPSAQPGVPGFPRGPGLPGNPAGGSRPNAGASNPGGPRIINQALLIDIADSVTTDGASMQPGLMNVNTASLEALMCLPGVSRELAQSIIHYRSSSGFLPNTAALLRVPGMSADLFKQLARRVTVRSETFRILCEGRVKSSGVRQRLMVTVRVGTKEVQNLAWREDDL